MQKLSCLLVGSLAATTALSVSPLGRRAVLGGAAAALVIPPQAAFADGVKAAALFQEEDANDSSAGSAAVYKPRIKVASKGSANSMLAIAMPAKEPPAGDYVDCMWFMDAKNFKVVAGESYGENGLIKDKSLQPDTGVNPSYSTRIKAGMTVVPYIHAVKGGTWKGEEYVVN